MNFFQEKVSIYTVILLTLLTSCIAHAQQRMGIAAGVIELGESGVRSIPTYCLDYSRRTPKPSDIYSRVLSDETRTVVTVGNQRMSLQQALDRNIVSIEGQHLSAADFLRLLNNPRIQAGMPADIRTQAQRLAEIYRSGSPVIRRKIETELEPIVRERGDYTHLQFKNKTNEKVKIEVLENAALGARLDDRNEDLLLNGIGSAKTSKQQELIQKQRWNMGLQKKLADLGYYSGTIDGVAGSATKQAIQRFQTDHGFLRLGDHDTDAALNAILEHKRIEASNPGNLMATLVRHRGNQERYTLSTASGGTAFSTSSVTELATRLNEHIGAVSANHVYVEFQGFESDEADAMVFNLRNGTRDLSADVQGIHRGEGGDVESLLFRRDLSVKPTEIKYEEVTEGPRKGWIRSTIEFAAKIKNRAKTITLTLYAKTRELATEWTNTVLAMVTRRPAPGAPPEFAVDSSMSIGDIVRVASNSFRKRHPNIKDSDFGAEVRDMTGAVQIVQVIRKSLAA